MKKITNNFLTITLIAFALLFVSTAYNWKDSEFSGNWSRNLEQCNVSSGLSINSIPTDIEIIQTGHLIEVKRTLKNGAGQISNTTEVLKLDGSITEINRPNGKIKKSSIQWSTDKTYFIETSVIVDNQGKNLQRSTETLNLVNGGKCLQIKAAINLDGQDYTYTGIFDKKTTIEK
jgi:hypothetical protein